MSDASDFSKRERGIMDALHRLGESSVQDVHDALPNAASYDAIRVALAELERKGHVRHRREGRRYVYRPARRTEQVRASALKHLVGTFFDDSIPDVVSTLLGGGKRRISDDELDELARLIESERRRRKA